METIADTVQQISVYLPFTSATWFVFFIIGFMFWIFATSRDEKSERVIYWEDMIIDPMTNTVNPYKVGYLIGVIVSTWIVISMTDTKDLSFDIMLLYLTYLLGGASWSEFVNKGKLPTNSPPTDNKS